MSKNILIDTTNNIETRIAVTEDGKLDDFEIETNKKNAVKGDIYLAKITRIEPSLQAAFVDFGTNRNGFLPLTEIHPDYFKIPTADKKKLLEQEFNESQNLSISEDEENFIDENFNEDQENTEQPENKNNKNDGFLSKVFDFFNYKPIDDYPQTRLKKKRFVQTVSNLYLDNIAYYILFQPPYNRFYIHRSNYNIPLNLFFDFFLYYMKLNFFH